MWNIPERGCFVPLGLPGHFAFDLAGAVEMAANALPAGTAGRLRGSAAPADDDEAIVEGEEAGARG